MPRNKIETLVDFLISSMEELKKKDPQFESNTTVKVLLSYLEHGIIVTDNVIRKQEQQHAD